MCKYDCDNPDPNMLSAERRLYAALSAPGLRELVCAYFHSTSGFAGLTFDSLGDNPPDKVTSDDLLAVTLLDVRWRPSAVRSMLGSQAGQISELLSEIDTKTTLWAENGGRELCKAERLWKVIDALEGAGDTLTSKLLARKRPLLVPITDSIIVRAVANPGQTWVTLRYCFQRAPFRQAVESLRPPLMENVGLLRIFDVAIWMLWSDSRPARQTRERLGVPDLPWVRGLP